MRVAILAILANNGRVVELVCLQECLRVAVRVDVDLRDAIVQERVLIALGDARFQPRQDHAEPVALLDLGDKLLHGACGADILQQRLDEILGAIEIDQRTNDGRALQGVHLHNIHLDVFHQRILVQVLRELGDEAVQVANVDERAGIRQLRLLKEVLHRHRIVDRALTTDTLHLLHVAATAGGLDVLEVNLGVCAGGQDGAEEVERALVGAEAFEHLYYLASPDLLVVLDGHLHHNLQILPVVPEEVCQALERRLGGHARKVIDQKLRRHLVGVQHHALQIRRVRVVLQGPLHQARLLAELADVGAVVMCEHVHLQNRLGNFRRLLQVHRQQLRLQVGLVWPVALERLKENGRRLLEPVLLHEDLDDHVDVD
mmetsp:Transcript_104692/g.302993  ORF Transcript_104692/g.302993 Transcript_104692/m.302993 type:complete len:372 (+) Transcript_104692:2594-3709(+)